LPRIHAVAVVHQAAELFPHLNGKLRQAGRDQPRVIRLDLVINVIRALVELRVAGIRRRDAGAQIIPAGPVRAPERVAAVGKIQTRLPNGNVQAVLFERAQERHLDVEIILAERVVNHRGLPNRDLVGGDDSIPELELRRGAPRHPRDLPDPAGFHLVPVFRQRQAAKFRRLLRRGQPARRDEGANQSEQQRSERFHAVIVDENSAGVNGKARDTLSPPRGAGPRAGPAHQSGWGQTGRPRRCPAAAGAEHRDRRRSR